MDPEIIRILKAAIAVVKNPAWAGMCDEDIELEESLKAAGLI